jgi:antirestriction protein ArdC
VFQSTPLKLPLCIPPQFGWLNVLNEDKRAIFSATAHAQRAADFLNGLQPKEAAA